MNRVRKNLVVQRSFRLSEDLDAKLRALHQKVGGGESDFLRIVIERGILHFNFVEASLEKARVYSKNKKTPGRNPGANKERKNEDSHFA